MREMICDNLAAGITYQGTSWTKEYQLSYYLLLHKLKKEIDTNITILHFLQVFLLQVLNSHQLNDELQRLTTVLNKDYNLHFSIGYAKYDESLKTSTDILKKADEGLYKIKKSRTHLVDILQ